MGIPLIEPDKTAGRDLLTEVPIEKSEATAGSIAVAAICDLADQIYHVDLALSEIRGAMVEGGALVFVTQNLASAQDRWDLFLGKSPRLINPLDPGRIGHIHPFTAGSATALLKATGFTLTSLQSDYVGWQRKNGKWPRSERLARRFPGLGDSLIVTAEACATEPYVRSWEKTKPKPVATQPAQHDIL